MRTDSIYKHHHEQKLGDYRSSDICNYCGVEWTVHITTAIYS